MLRTTLLGIRYNFRDTKDVLAKANEEKTGDQMAGIAAETAAERVAAKVVLSELTLEELKQNPVIPPEKDSISRLGLDLLDNTVYEKIKSMTVGQLREYLLRESPGKIKKIMPGLTAEMIAGTAKLMGNMDLINVARKIINPVTCNTTIGLPGVFAGRLQPNNARDDIDGIMASTMEGMSYAVGDAVIGVNPASGSVHSTITILQELKNFMLTWDIPTQNCVLSHITIQMAALKAGAPMDLMFQSLAGTEDANTGFGISIAMMDEAYALMKEKKSSTGPNFMYFETGQGSELALEANHGADQVTLEARCYTLAKKYHPFLVNTVVGFMGPEYLYDGKQTSRAGLEDHYMGKLSGLPMGIDCCHTNHMNSDQNDSDNLAMLAATAGCTFIMGIPVADDVMLMNQTTSFHDIATIREALGKHPIKEFEEAMERLGIMENGHLTKIAGDPSIFMR
ncbi:Ethanolamine ammonia-lyase heavy chain [Propionispora sp. 2/2-37]|uniref:ethanolamine ammonia-lyase subunit EutB n=1 Tax=Propionispora sp. 2/2-37 TaxID=1677858 RepID=UPI0006C6B2CB|nr:ethanolamine ammonia-lyase subunit EutB [Propionispora sp. 2/2-37]CUH95378.1 Ethanolamine ammonia-lyase heavy chain [Propionispora sp. 2/2-37]